MTLRLCLSEQGCKRLFLLLALAALALAGCCEQGIRQLPVR
jgi:hypothetical protein